MGPHIALQPAAEFQIVFCGLLQDGSPVCIGQTAGDFYAMLKALLNSCNGLQVSALMLTRYLSNHFHYWAGGEMG